MFKKFWHWLHDEEGWKALSGLVYLTICIFDFIIVPSWIGVMRKDITGDILTGMAGLDPSVQVALVQSITVQHQPFTLQGGGLFHLAFGALLTGTAITSIRAGKIEEQK